MTGKQLKNSILQLAIQGKLVPQDPHDEPASELLKRIRKEKEQLVKEGKLKKKDLETTPIAEEEKPFEIPETWEWVHFGDVTFNRDSERIPLSVSERSSLKKLYDYYGASGVIDKVDRPLFNKPLLLIGEDGANLINRSTPIAFIARGEYWVNNHAHVLDYIDEDFMKYVCMHINAISLVDYVTGTAQPKMNQEKMNSIPLAIPPKEEQKRILVKIEELMPLVEEYDKAQSELDKLNESLPEQLKKSILQQAIMGKLVPQDSNDEPASELLKRIHKEKENLVKSGALKKKDLVTTPISDDEKPFDIPESWEWVRLKDICVKIVDGDHNPPSSLSYKTNYFMLSSKNINDNQLVDLDSVRFLDEETFNKENERTRLTVGDILFTSVGSIGRSCIVTEPLNICFQRSVSVLTTKLLNTFLKYQFDSPFIQQYIIDNATGTAQKGFYLNQMEQLVIAVPPLSEQYRIVAKIEELFSILK